MSEGVIIIDADGMIQICNESATRILGLTKEEIQVTLTTKGLWESIRADSASFSVQDHPITITRRTGKPGQNIRLGIKKADSSVAWVSLTTLPFSQPNTENHCSVLVTFSDITEQVTAENELRLLNELLEAKVAQRTAQLSETNRKLASEIAERFQVEQALAANQEKLQEILSSVDDVIFSLKPGTEQVLYINNAAEKIFGHPLASYYENSTLWRAMIHPDDVAGFDQSFAVYQQTGIFNAELRIKRPDKQIRWIHARGRSIYDADGSHCRSIGIVTDITERKTIEEALRASEEQLRLALKAAKMEIWEWDLADKLNFNNDERAIELFGIATHTFQEFAELIHPADTESIAVAIRKTLSENKELHTLFRVLAPNGTEQWLEAHGVLKTGREGDSHLLGVIQDVSERQQSEAALRNSEAEYRELADAMPQIVFKATPTGKINYINRDWRKIFELDLLKTTSTICDLSLHPDDEDKIVNGWLNAVQSASTFEMEHRLHLKEAGYQWHLTRAIPIKNETGEILHWIGTSTNIHAHKKAEEALSELLHRVVSAQEDERHRIGRELHDHIGQLLTALHVGLKSLECPEIDRSEKLNKLSDVQNIAASIGEELRNLLNDLRPAALDELGLPVALEQHLSDWASHFDITVDYHFRGDKSFRLPSIIEINLYRIAQEALNNIVKHANATSTCVILEYTDEFVRMIIEDNGSGFDHESEKNMLMEDRKFGLLGMKERLGQLSGDVEIESLRDQGTSLFIRIPLLRSDTAREL